jgi:beta-N-acetylhexosaminidase
MTTQPINQSTTQPLDLTDEQLAGQRLLVGFDGTRFDADLEFLIGEINVGGIIIFSRNVESPEQLRELISACQAHASACCQPPLIVAVDQEGGPVARLRAPFTEFAGNAKMAGEADAIRFARITAQELSSVGINMDFAPVLDLAPTEIDSIMADRSFGPDPERAARLGTSIIRHLQSAGVMAVAKHFPGIGRTTLDSHLDMPVLDAGYDLLDSADLVPFRAAIENQVAGVMLSHIRYTGLDPDWPASLSSVVVDRLLRQKMGYAGVTMTDDLDMGAIGRHMDLSTAVSRILTVGIDLALICHRSPDIEAAFDQILSSIQSDQAVRQGGEKSVSRVLAMKRRYIRTGWEAGKLGG